MTRSDAPIRLELASSRLLAAGIGLAALLAVAAVLGSGLPVSVALVVAAGVGVVTLRAARAARRLPGTTLRIEADGAVNLRDPDGSEQRAVLAGHATVGPLVVLVLRPSGGPVRRLPVFRDAVDDATWRLLRVFVAHAHEADSYKP